VRRAAATIAALAVLTGCGGDDPRPGTLTVDERWTDGPFFIEGHVAFASVRDPSGRLMAAARRLPARRKPPILTRRLAPGRYRVAGHVRSCAPSCTAGLDPPTDHCGASVEIDGDTRVTFVRSERGGCYVDVAQP
jgi:hypothetical protein